MPNLSTKTVVSSGRSKETLQLQRTYNQIIDHKIELDDADAGILLLSSSKTIGMGNLPTAKYLLLKNEGKVPVEIIISLQSWKTASGTNGDDGVDSVNAHDLDGGGSTNDKKAFLNFIIPAGEHFEFPSIRMLTSWKSETRANATQLDAFDPTSINSGAFYVDTTCNTAEDMDTSETDLDVNQAGFLKAGDYITIHTDDTEVMKIISKSDGDTDLGTGAQTLTVERAVLGSTATASTNGEAVNLYYQNSNFTLNNTDYRGGGDGTGTEVIKTDENGNFSSTNFFGYGRKTDSIADGIVPGSVTIQFQGVTYQKFGLSGLTGRTQTGLTASTEYGFNINDSGGGAVEVTFTTSATNSTFGGSDGLIRTIQSALDSEYNGTGNLKGRQINVYLENGDICFYNENRTGGTSLVFTNPSTATNLFGAGIFPAYNNLGDYRVGGFDTLYSHDNLTYVQSLDQKNMIYDDGSGGLGNGTINYETGALNLTGCPKNSEMRVWASTNSAFSGGNSVVSDGFNQWLSIRGRSVNSRVSAELRIIAYE